MCGAVALFLFLALFHLTDKLPVEVKDNSVMLSTLRIWHDITKYTGRKHFSLGLQPLIKNKAFPPGISPSIFNDWYLKELRFVSDLFEDGNFMSFAQIQNKYEIPHKHFFGFL